VLAVAADVTKADEVERLIGATVTRFGAIDILVNNAGGTGRRSPFHELSDEEWSASTVCEPWRVRDVVAHLVGIELANISRRRDGTTLGPSHPSELSAWLGRFNDEWVAASSRLSPRVMRDLLAVAGEWFETYLGTLDVDAIGGSVSWAGAEPAPIWLDVAREYTERWVHQQQIREACDRPGLMEPEYLAPVLRAFAHALPKTFEGVHAEAGTAVEVVIAGDGLGHWHVVQIGSGWDLRDGPHHNPSATVTLTPSGAWRLFTKHPNAQPPKLKGDRRLGDVVARAVAIIR
jgi:uncharacterized protein (TIGR03083 family)